MSATATLPTQPEAPAERGLLLPCPMCGEAEATVRLDLSDMDTCTCAECDGEFSLNDLQERMARWRRILSWVNAFPQE